MPSLFIDGPAGLLEAQLEAAAEADAPAALLAHPHPQMGGTMNDAVLDTAAAVLRECGSACLRFNFRGAGRSAGTFDNGNGERDDLRAALAWLREQTGGPLSFVGYSFGSWVGWNVIAADAPALARVALIAPPIGMLDYPDASTEAQVDIYAGTADDYVKLDAVKAWAERNGAKVHPISGADHFFGGHWDNLAAAMR